jgi:hypothetical protein
MYLCNRLKLCRVSPNCGKDCVLTKDKANEMKPQKGQMIVVNNLAELNWWRDILRQTEIDYKVEGFKIVFL